MARGGRPDPRKALERQLRIHVWPEWQRKANGLAYRGPADFLLQHGEWFEPRQLPAGYQPGKPRMCFGNAICTAALYDIDYVEGYALDPGALWLPIHHGWCADAGGLVDPTWATGEPILARQSRRPTLLRGVPGAAYLGVRFSLERADDCTWNGDQNVLNDFERGWPLLREPWTGEPEGLEWPPSDRLDLLRANAHRVRQPA